MKTVETLTGFDDRRGGNYYAGAGIRFTTGDDRANDLVKQKLVKVIDHGVPTSKGKRGKGAPENKQSVGPSEDKTAELADVGGTSLDRMKRDELVELAGGYGIVVPEGATKAEIVALIDEAKG